MKQATITVEGIELSGWLREEDGAFLWWGPRPPGLDDGYEDFGWHLFRNGRFAEPYFGKVGERPANPNDPPFRTIPVR